jgi:hypothetical protein
MSDRPTYRVRHGGLMRCCLATLQDRMATCAPDPVEDEVIKCAQCANWMVFHDRAWEWDNQRSRQEWEKD